MIRQAMIALTAAILGFALSGCGHDQRNHPLEDQPGWNCLVDGNGHCGPTYTAKVRLVAYWDCEDGEDTDYSYSDNEC